MKRIKYIAADRIERIKWELTSEAIRDLRLDFDGDSVGCGPVSLAEDLERYVGRLEEIGKINNMIDLHTHLSDWGYVANTAEFDEKYKADITTVDVPDGYIVETVAPVVTSKPVVVSEPSGNYDISNYWTGGDELEDWTY